MKTTAPLRLDIYFFDSLSIKVNPKGRLNYHLTEEQLVIDAEYSLNMEDPTKHKVILTVKNRPEDPSATYLFSATVIGIFTVSDPADQNSLPHVVVTGSSMLFGGIREMLLNLTGRGPFPTLILPTVSSRIFIELFEEQTKNQTAVPDFPKSGTVQKPRKNRKKGS